MAKEKKNIAIEKSDILAILDSLTEYDSFEISVMSSNLRNMNIEDRMDFVLTGLRMGMLPITVFNLCEVTPQQFAEWYRNEDNAARYNKTIALADAKLEIIVHQLSLRNPLLALTILEKRNAKRWSPDIIPGMSEKKTAKTISELIEQKNNTILPDFDVENATTGDNR